jgi:hypothetical protein
VHLVRGDGRIETGTLESLPLALSSLVMLVQGIAMAGLIVLLALRAWPDPQAQRLAIGFLFTGFLVGGNVVVAEADGFISHLFFAARQQRIDAIRALATEVDAVEDVAAVATLVSAHCARTQPRFARRRPATGRCRLRA